MSKGEDYSKTEIQRLQKQIQQIQQENKVLNIRAQALQVLGKVLQDSQDDNSRLKQEVDQLKTQLIEKGIDPSQAQLSMIRLNSDDGSQSTMTEHTSGAYSSVSRGVAGHDYVNVTTVSGPQSISAGYPSLLNGDLHIKDIRTEFQQIRGEVDQLMNNTRQLSEKIKFSVGEDGELQVKLAQLSLRLKEYAKEAGTRETLSGALVYEEEQIRDKLLAMEAEQASHENVAHQLKDKLGESKEEFERIQDEIKFFQEAVLVQTDPTLCNTSQVPSASASERTGSRSSVEQAIVVKSPLWNSGHGTCEGCDRLQRQLSELQRQVLEVTKERDESLRLKEEILDVNHKWDLQYKMLQEVTSQENADLKKQVEVLKSSQRQSRIDQQTLDPTNPGRNFQGGSVEKQPPHLAAPPTAVPQTTLNSPRHVPPWTGVAPNPQGISPDIIDEIEVLKQQLRVYADDFATERNDRERVQTEKEAMREELTAVKEQVQTLEQQLQIYEEDFKREKREKETLQQHMRAMQLGGAYGGYQDMSQRARNVAEQQARVQAIREVHDREKNKLMREQQELQQHVFAKQTTPQRHTAASSQYLPGYGGARMGYSGQPLPQRQWERNNYPLVTRGPSVAGNRASFPTRGPIGYPTDQRSTSESMFHGGEVLPDRGEDVVDSASDVKEQGETAAAAAAADERETEELAISECPRCLRRFDEDGKDSILKHIEKCIS